MTDHEFWGLRISGDLRNLLKKANKMSWTWRIAVLSCLLLLCRPGTAGKCLKISGQTTISQGACSGVTLNDKGVCVSDLLSEAQQQQELQDTIDRWTTFLNGITDAQCVTLFEDVYCALASVLDITKTKLTGCDGANGCPLIMTWGIETGCETDAQCGDHAPSPTSNLSTPTPCCEGLANAFIQMCEGATYEVVTNVYPALQLALLSNPPRSDRYFCRAQPNCVNAAPAPSWPCAACHAAWSEVAAGARTVLSASDTLSDSDCSTLTSAIDTYASCMATEDESFGFAECCTKYAEVLAEEEGVVSELSTVCPSSSYSPPECVKGATGARTMAAGWLVGVMGLLATAAAPLLAVP